MALDTAHSAELEKSHFTRFTAVQITLPTYVIRLLDGAGFCSFPVGGQVQTFNGSDPIFGTLANIGSISEAQANSSPRLDIYLLPPTTDALGYLANPNTQGSKVMVWEGALNVTTGQVIGSPALLWSGRIDQPEITAAQGSRMIRLDTCGALERLFVSTETDALNVTFATHMFGEGQTGLAGNVDAMAPLPWGRAGEQPITYGGLSPQVGGNSSGRFVGGGGGDVDSSLF